jgi:capsular polysaccharide biosynthesis protein
MLKDVKKSEIFQNKKLNNSFSSASLNEINQQCKIFNGDFYLDSFNYFPVSRDYETFYSLFKRDDDNSIDHFYTEEFYKNLIDKKSKFKTIKNSFVLGSSPADNYFSNLINFFPRIFFINEKKINLVIHRNLSNKLRSFIKSICQMRNIEITFNFIDDGFYKFENSSIPQFLDINSSVNVLKYFIDKILLNIKTRHFGSKIYIRRENSNYRKILNEADLIEKLRKQDFEIINPQHFEILDQMKIFSNAEIIISPHGSNLSNIIFSNKGTKIIEISPNFKNPYEINISARYKSLSENAGLQFNKIISDTVDVKNHSDLVKKYINKKILSQSDYYKNMIIKISDIDKLVNSL